MIYLRIYPEAKEALLKPTSKHKETRKMPALTRNILILIFTLGSFLNSDSQEEKKEQKWKEYAMSLPEHGRWAAASALTALVTGAIVHGNQRLELSDEYLPLAYITALASMSSGLVRYCASLGNLVALFPYDEDNNEYVKIWVDAGWLDAAALPTAFVGFLIFCFSSANRVNRTGTALLAAAALAIAAKTLVDVAVWLAWELGPSNFDIFSSKF